MPAAEDDEGQPLGARFAGAGSKPPSKEVICCADGSQRFSSKSSYSADLGFWIQEIITANHLSN